MRDKVIRVRKQNLSSLTKIRATVVRKRRVLLLIRGVSINGKSRPLISRRHDIISPSKIGRAGDERRMVNRFYTRQPRVSARQIDLLIEHEPPRRAGEGNPTLDTARRSYISQHPIPCLSGEKCSGVVFNQSSERADVPRALRFTAFYRKIDLSNTTCETKESPVSIILPIII